MVFVFLFHLLLEQLLDDGRLFDCQKNEFVLDNDLRKVGLERVEFN